MEALGLDRLLVSLLELSEGRLQFPVEPAVLHHQRGLVRERLREPDLVGVVHAPGPCARGERADHAVLDYQGYGEERANLALLDMAV